MWTNNEFAVEDQIVDLLEKVVAFTELRQKLINENIQSINSPDFIPKRYPVLDFANVISRAVVEHICSDRIILCDTDNVSFGENGSFSVEPEIDYYAKKLYEADVEKYLDMQASRLAENSINNRMARQLLMQRQQVAVIA